MHISKSDDVTNTFIKENSEKQHDNISACISNVIAAIVEVTFYHTQQIN